MGKAFQPLYVVLQLPRLTATADGLPLSNPLEEYCRAIRRLNTESLHHRRIGRLGWWSRVLGGWVGAAFGAAMRLGWVGLVK